MKDIYTKFWQEDLQMRNQYRIEVLNKGILTGGCLCRSDVTK
jgi:hypothetical protein